MSGDKKGGKPAMPGHEGKVRRSGSLAWRLTLGQMGRMLRIMLSIDVLAVLLYASLLFVELEHTAGRLTERRPAVVSEYAAMLPDTEARVIPGEEVSGFRLHHQIEERLGLPAAAVRSVWLEQDSPLWGVVLRPVYTVAVPYEEGYLEVRFDLGAHTERLCYGLLVLGALELLLLIRHTGGTRRSVRRALAPISQLAAATQSMTAETDPNRQRPRKQAQEKPSKAKTKAEELELAGTIDTLNKITAKKLDTRIAIAGERQELQGLAGAINSMLDRLDAAYSSQLRFVSDASHELRTPIAVLQGYANLLDRWGKDDPAVLQESIDAIKAETEGMKVLVEQLLFLARSDNNSIIMDEQPLDVSSLAGEVLRETQLVDEGHQLVSDIESGLWVDGDNGLLKQALRIFVDNAVKYTPAGERITISVKADGELVYVSVTDNGIGIPDEELPHVLERFYRADESRARKTGGTGLGLSIANWIVKRHDGYLEVLSRQDVGTRMTMVLPVGKPVGAAGSEIA